MAIAIFNLFKELPAYVKKSSATKRYDEMEREISVELVRLVKVGATSRGVTNTAIPRN